MGNMAQGIGSIGQALGNYNMGVTQGWGTLGSQLQGMYGNAANQAQTNAANFYNKPIDWGTMGLASIQGLGGGQGGPTVQTTK